MGRYFGTDGIRGEATAEWFQPPFLARLASGLARFLRESGGDGPPPRVVLGRDPRPSGAAIADVLTRELAAWGVRVDAGGVGPTPAMARAVIERGCAAGVVITASHNPAGDNGIKLFKAGGLKFSAEEEARLEDLIDQPASRPKRDGAPAEPHDAVARYIDFVVARSVPGLLAGRRIVVDCANGATVRTTPEVLRRLGAEVVAIGVDPDGGRINDGVGSEHLERLQERVRREQADCGLAHDGDGDRLVLIEPDGTVVPGDAVLGFVGAALAQANRGTPPTVVATVMSNLGLDRAVERAGGRVERTAVGDRNVLHAMLAGGHDFGGEASGHLIFRRALPTGDGLIAALEIFRLLADQNRTIEAVRAAVSLFPQEMRNLRVAEKIPLDALPVYAEAIAAIHEALGERGRVLVRYSGTEPKIRLLVEADDAGLARQTLAELEALTRRFLDVIG